MTPSPPLPPPLLSVSAAVPDDIQAVPHLFQSINSFLLPRTIDAAVYSDLHGVVATFGDGLPVTSRAMDGAAARGRLTLSRGSSLPDQRAAPLKPSSELRQTAT